MRNGPPTKPCRKTSSPPPPKKQIVIEDEIKIVEKPDYLGFIFVMKVFGL